MLRKVVARNLGWLYSWNMCIQEIYSGKVAQKLFVNASPISAKVGNLKRIKFMPNPPNSNQNSGSYVDLLKRMTEHVQQKKVDSQILEIVKQVFDKELGEEKIELTHSERKRLFHQVVKVVLTEMLAKFDSEE